MHIRVDLLDTLEAGLVSLPGSFPLPDVDGVLGIAHERGRHHIWRDWELDRHGIGEFLILEQLTIGGGISPSKLQKERLAVVHRLHTEVGNGAPIVGDDDDLGYQRNGQWSGLGKNGGCLLWIERDIVFDERRHKHLLSQRFHAPKEHQPDHRQHIGFPHRFTPLEALQPARTIGAFTR
jgi:hypothetical protein